MPSSTRRSSVSAGSTPWLRTPGFQHVAPVREFPEERWDALLAVLLTSPFLLAKYAWDALAASGDGRFCVVASAHGARRLAVQVGATSPRSTACSAS